MAGVATATSSPRQSRFVKATRKKIKLRAAVDGPSGSGKSYTALTFAHALASLNGGGGRIACIDTEHGALSKYASINGWDFDVLELTSFSPSEYVAAIEEAGSAGYDVIVIDSLSHAWEGKDGALELVDKKGGNSFTAWKDVTPMHRRMIEAILASPAHVIGTMRSKTEYVLETNEKGKQVPRKIGLAPIQRQGMEYEFDLYGSMDHSHVLTITKSRCPAVDGAVVVKPGDGFLLPVINWLETGESTPAVEVVKVERADEETIQSLVGRAANAGITPEKLIEQLPRLARVTELSHLLADQIKPIEQWIDGEARRKAMAAGSGAKKQASPRGRAAAARAMVPSTEDQLDAMMGGNGDASESQPMDGQTSQEDSGPHAEQLEAIQDLRERLDRAIGSPEWYGAALVKRRVKSPRDLTPDQAAELIASMQQNLIKLTESESETSPDWVGPPACSWPRVMQSMVAVYGAKEVWASGLFVLGYPPTWAHTVGEANRVSDYLKRAFPPTDGE